MFFVRTAGRPDLPAIARLLAETWHDTYDRLYGAEKVDEIVAAWHSVTALEARLNRPHSEFVVADDGTRLGGMAYAARSTEHEKRVMLYQLYVSPDCQGKGIGTALLEEVNGAFPDATILRLEVAPANAKAVGFYQAHGFEKVGETSDCGGDSGLPADIYERQIIWA
ncbi:GNAT family N-acetyltransferase [Breoghania sp. JC706]|uniref:GNAT family N-acetyltransferase n=1 Tax=Breoghania sp. JC706 TaxID=3117732 RepID=UPI00300A86C7